MKYKLCDKCRLEIAQAMFNQDEKDRCEFQHDPDGPQRWEDQSDQYQQWFFNLAEVAHKQIEHIREHGHDAELEETCH